MKHKQQCGEQDITSSRLSNESQLYCMKPFHENPLCFQKYADFEADNDFDKTQIGNKTTNIDKENPLLNG